MQKGKILKVCKKGHKFYKSSDCPVCPKCEADNKPEKDFLSLLAAPARRALENNGIMTLEQLSKISEKELLAFHGMGKSSVPVLKKALAAEGLSLKSSLNGQLRKPATKSGKLTIKYHASGKSIWSKGKIEKGQPEGYWEWYRTDGTLKRSGHFRKGEPVGEWITYDKAGKKYKVTQK